MNFSVIVQAQKPSSPGAVSETLGPMQDQMAAALVDFCKSNPDADSIKKKVNEYMSTARGMMNQPPKA